MARNSFPKFFSILFFFVILLVFVSDAHAYIDLGTGTYIVQMLVAGALACLLYTKIILARIKKFFTGFFRKRNQDD